MAILRFGISMSLDGYVAGPNQSVANPLGEGGEQLHKWAFAVRGFRQLHGMEGGTTGQDDEIAAESLRNIGATIMVRHMFGGGEGPWGEPALPPSRLRPHASLPRAARDAGRDEFHFVTEGIHAALERAKAAAGGKDVNLGGGADVAQQYLRAGLIDEMEIHVVPVMLGAGTRLFDNTDGRQTAYECVRVVSSPSVTPYKYLPRKEEPRQRP